MGFCPQCRVSEGLVQVSERPGRSRSSSSVPVALAKAGGATVARLAAGIGEIDRVLGGGFVPGAVVLLGGEPGVGKSTLILQIAGALTGGGSKVLIASAEESAEQVSLRAERLEIEGAEVFLLAEADIDDILGAADQLRPDLLVIDSIQTVMAAEAGSAPGSVTQVRECAARVMRYAKDSGTAAVLVGHVTKDGGIAGPKTLEHMVDVVLYLEGESESGLRGLRSLKNRFGATHLMPFNEMAHQRLREVAEPSMSSLINTLADRFLYCER